MADAAAGGFLIGLYVVLIFIWSCLPCIIICVAVGGAIGLVAYCINKSNREERENAMRKRLITTTTIGDKQQKK
uniref:Uncharacterized protein n=1 Tax=Meloidogyne floridensis TaxID=298350 RepID=A0A915NKR9_9BILA